MKYQVKEVYTPEDTDQERRRHKAEFTSESTDIFELAVQARLACHPKEHQTEKTVANIRKQLEFDDVPEQLEAEDFTCFSFFIFSNNGEFEITVEAELPPLPLPQQDGEDGTTTQENETCANQSDQTNEQTRTADHS